MASYFSLVLISLLFGWVSRMAGGGPPRLPWVTDQLIYALPYAIIAAPAGPWAILAYAGAVLGKLTGHGGGIDLGHSVKGRDPERLEFLIRFLRGRISEYWYDVLLLTVTGLAVTLLPGVVILLLDPRAGVLIVLSGLLKAPAYMIGWLIYPKGKGRGIPHLNGATEIGEFLTGFLCIGSLILCADGLS